jgi:para-aminobenzoate synthetase/4-amino-4-deoxychorismate lyase
MLLSASGTLDVTSTPLDAQSAGPVRLKLAAAPVRIDNPFLYHKTTRRDVYDTARASVDDCDDVLLWNSEGYLTEATIANVAVNIGGRLYTPPEECGLLAGTWRGRLLASGEIEQRRIRVDEVPVGEEVLLFNSVRGVYKGVRVG